MDKIKFYNAKNYFNLKKNVAKLIKRFLFIIHEETKKLVKMKNTPETEQIKIEIKNTLLDIQNLQLNAFNSEHVTALFIELHTISSNIFDIKQEINRLNSPFDMNIAYEDGNMFATIVDIFQTLI